VPTGADREAISSWATMRGSSTPTDLQQTLPGVKGGGGENNARFVSFYRMEAAVRPGANVHRVGGQIMFISKGDTRDYGSTWVHAALRWVLAAVPMAAIAGIKAGSLASFSLSPTTLTAGGNSTGTVVVSGLCKSCVALVSVTSGTPSVATAPGTVTTSNGISGSSATFAVHAVSGAAGCSLITAKTGTSFQSVMLTVQPSAGTGLSLTLKSTSVVGGSVDSGVVAMPPRSTALSTNPVALLSTSDDNIATVPSSVTLKPNFIEGGIIIYKAAFPISTRDSGRLTCAGITATSGTSKAQTLLQLFTASG
jgi:hypothetical protein